MYNRHKSRIGAGYNDDCTKSIPFVMIIHRINPVSVTNFYII